MDPLELAADLVRTPGTSGHEKAVADRVERAMHILGYRNVQRDQFGSVFGLVGPDHGRPKALFDGHLDVVPVVGEWTVPPFEGMVRDGRLFGRGSNDMKSGLAAALCGVAAAARESELNYPIAVSATVLEETIEGLALGSVMDDLEPENVVICEPTGLEVFVKQRGRAEIVMTAHGKPAHAARPDAGKCPITLANRGLTALEGLELPSEPAFGGAISVATDIISEPYPSISMIPLAVRVRFDRRTLPDEEKSAVLGTMMQCLMTVDPTAFSVEVSCGAVETYTGQRLTPERFLHGWQLDTDHPLAQSALGALKKVGLAPTFGDLFPGCTNGSESAGRRGVPTVILGPGTGEASHTIDESIAVDQIYQAMQVYKELSWQLAEAAIK
jgi:putative selenium metabolism hydrolase